MFLRLGGLLLLLSSTTFAQPAEVERTRPTTARLIAPTLLAGATALGSSVAGFATGLAMTRVCFDDVGRPSPLCNAGVFAFAGAVQLAVNLLLLPELYRLADANIGEVRLGTWRWLRWPALLLAASAVTFLVGAAMETKTFDTGQGAMVAGLGGAVASGLTLDVFAVIGAVRGATP